MLQAVARQELANDYWLRMVADLGGRSFEEMRVIVLEFLDTDIFHLSREHCVSFLEPLIESWDIDLATFALDISLNARAVSEHVKRFEFVEREPDQLFVEEPGLTEFLQNASLSGTASEEEIEFLKRLRFKGKRPDSPVFLPRAAEPQGPAAFSHAVNANRLRPSRGPVRRRRGPHSGPEDLSSNGRARLGSLPSLGRCCTSLGVAALCSHAVRDARRAASRKEHVMTEPTPQRSRELPSETRAYLAHRLDGARDLYLLALALGDRPEGSALFGRMIREARIHFAAVIEEARIAGLPTGAIAVMLGKRNIDLADSIQPELWTGVEKLLAERAARKRAERR